MSKIQVYGSYSQKTFLKRTFGSDIYEHVLMYKAEYYGESQNRPENLPEILTLVTPS